jgi:pilus assembly protein CpaE
MRCFVASDDIAMAKQVSDLLVQLGHNCPASRILRLDQIVPAVDAILRSAPPGGTPKGGSGGSAADGLPEVVVVVFPADPERALTVLQDLRRRVAEGILAVGPATDTKLVLRALREGASEYLDQTDLRPELTGALQRRDTTEKVGRVIAVLAPSGGSGGSTIAANVATILAQNHSGCALIDLNLQTGDLVAFLDLKPAYTLADLCQNAERLDHSLLQGCLARHASGVQLLAAPARIAEAARVTPAAVELVLSLAVKHFPYVVVDLDHSYRAEQLAAMRRADVILLVLRLDFISLRNTRRALDSFQESGIPRERVRVVANRCGQPGEISSAQAEESLGIKISHSIPEDQKTVNRAVNNGVPLVLQSSSARISRALVELATSLAALKPAG